LVKVIKIGKVTIHPQKMTVRLVSILWVRFLLQLCFIKIR